MNDQTIVAYFYRSRDGKPHWYTPGNLPPDLRGIALPYTVIALLRRREYGRDVPGWIAPRPTIGEAA